jgi:hypothetical protein
MMKQLLTTTLILLLSFHSQAQMSDFEFPNIPAAGYWNGSDQTGGFSSGDAYFPNRYDTSFGGYWASGFAWSTVNDTLTPGFSNLYASASGSGQSSAGYAVVQQGSVVRIPGGDRVLQAVSFNNGTYAWLSMRDGDGFAKKFGGASGNDPDFFKVVVHGFNNGTLNPDSVEFFLADFRFANNAQDYIIRSFTNYPLSTLGQVDSIRFTLRSSDNGPFGMNTPAFFVIDNLLIAPLGSLSEAHASAAPVVAPNPSDGRIRISKIKDFETLHVFDLSGKCLEVHAITGLDYLDFSLQDRGMYFLQFNGKSTSARQRLIVR